jgi:Uma2 family endonuclease
MRHTSFRNLEPTFSEEEYFALEAIAQTKREFVHGRILAMAGASAEHNLIVANLITELSLCLREQGCRVFPSDMLTAVAEGMFFYPDVSVVCGEPDIERRGHHGLDVLRNPTVVVEVHSRSTQNLDITQKAHAYLGLASLRYLLLVDSERAYLTLYARENEKKWRLENAYPQAGEAPGEESLEVAGCALSLKDIYRNVAFGQEG